MRGLLRRDFNRLRREGFSQTVLAALETIIKRYGESYEDLVRRAGANPIGRAAKLADLRDNSDLS